MTSSSEGVHACGACGGGTVATPATVLSRPPRAALSRLHESMHAAAACSRGALMPPGVPGSHPATALSLAVQKESYRPPPQSHRLAPADTNTPVRTPVRPVPHQPPQRLHLSWDSTSLTAPGTLKIIWRSSAPPPSAPVSSPPHPSLPSPAVTIRMLRCNNALDAIPSRIALPSYAYWQSISEPHASHKHKVAAVYRRLGYALPYVSLPTHRRPWHHPLRGRLPNKAAPCNGRLRRTTRALLGVGRCGTGTNAAAPAPTLRHASRAGVMAAGAAMSNPLSHTEGPSFAATGFVAWRADSATFNDGIPVSPGPAALPVRL